MTRVTRSRLILIATSVTITMLVIHVAARVTRRAAELRERIRRRMTLIAAPVMWAA